MSYAKNALMTGMMTAAGAYAVCELIPVVGPVVGCVMAGATFLVVETGAVAFFGVYAVSRGVAYGVNRMRDARVSQNEVSHEPIPLVSRVITSCVEEDSIGRKGGLTFFSAKKSQPVVDQTAKEEASVGVAP